MECHLLGWPADGPRLRLDHRRFAYAGKFVTAETGVAVVTDEGAGSPPSGEGPTPRTEPPADRSFADPPGPVVAAVAFNDDRTESATVWIRYVTVREDRRGEGLGGRVCAFLADRAHDRGYETVRIAVNNPFSYDALYKAGFAFTGRETGLAELVLARPAAVPAPRDPERYRAGLDVFRGRDLSDEESAFLDRAFRRGPPATDHA